MSWTDSNWRSAGQSCVSSISFPQPSGGEQKGSNSYHWPELDRHPLHSDLWNRSRSRATAEALALSEAKVGEAADSQNGFASTT